MAFPTFTFCPEFGAREIREPKTRPFRFGNGQERRYRFGLNNDLRKWELQFDYKDTAQREAILEFLEERNGWKRFTWTDPKGFTGLWRCREWDTTWNGYVQNSIRCTFEEDMQRAAPPTTLVDLISLSGLELITQDGRQLVAQVVATPTEFTNLVTFSGLELTTQDNRQLRRL
jgi:phage-related protein